MSGKLVTGGITVAILAVVMGITNPKPEAYTEYASTKMMNKGEKFICESIGGCTQGKIPEMVRNTTKNTVLKPTISATTKRQNLILMSFYTTDSPGIGKMKAVGILGNFITYSES